MLFSVVGMLLLLRFALNALGANPEAGFARFVYGLSAPLVVPFVGLFGSPQASGSTLEVSTLIALVVYLLLAWLIRRIGWLAFGETRAATVVRADTVHVETA